MSKTAPKRDILICRGKNAFAGGEYTEDCLIVFKGSACNLEKTRTTGFWVIGMRKKIIEKGVLVRR